MKKIIIGLVMGIVLMIGVNIVGASIESSGVMYNSKTLNTVLDDLYSKIEEINNTGDASSSDILIGKTALVKGTKVTGTMIDRGTNQTTEGFGCFPSGCGSGDSQYYAFNDIPEGYYHKDGYSWAPEIRVNANKFRSALGISADKIASGQSIAGITGTYTSDATASASNILSGKTAYVNGNKITGSMANKSGTTTAATKVTESGSNALISIPSSGYYDTNSKISVPIETIKNEVNVSNVSSGNLPVSTGQTSAVTQTVDVGFKPTLVLVYTVNQWGDKRWQMYSSILNISKAVEINNSSQQYGGNSSITITETGFTVTAIAYSAGQYHCSK